MKCHVLFDILRHGCIQKLSNKIRVKHVYVQTKVADCHNPDTYAQE